jgi:hypothetical protein
MEFTCVVEFARPCAEEILLVGEVTTDGEHQV